MKNLVIPFDKPSNIKSIVELAKRLGFKPRVEENTAKSIKPMNWKLMPEDESELEAMILKAQKNIKEGKYYTAEQVKEIVSKWK